LYESANSARVQVMYAEVAPPASVAAVVDCLWMRRSDHDGAPILVLPDGCFDLIWTPGAEVMLAAPDTHAAEVPAYASPVFVGIRFRPGVGRSVLGMRMSDLLDARVTAAEVLAGRAGDADRRTAADILARAGQTTSAREAFGMLGRLGEVLTRSAQLDHTAMRASRLLREPARSVASVADELDVPQRTLSRRVTEQVGYGPKMLHRVMRLQGFLGLADAPGTRELPLAELAARAGYADQPHLARDATSLTGRTPTRLLALR
jgi:AraC-like DNA-binding protein